MNNNKHLIIVHRGAPREAPENTLSSFRLALKQGCGGIELDVHLSLDGKIIVCHDSSIDRTTNGSGIIRQMFAEEIRRFDAGSWFSGKYSGERMPLLDEVFNLVPDDILINIELKHSYGGDMEPALLNFLWQHNRFQNVIISSYDHSCLYRLKGIEPKVKVGLLIVNLMDYMQNIEIINFQLYSIHPYYLLLTREEVQAVSLAGIKVFPFTVDTINELRKIKGYGISGIITNYPARLGKYAKKIYRK
jgi:glycerophosphoryl diester phosphodiesterase